MGFLAISKRANQYLVRKSLCMTKIDARTVLVSAHKKGPDQSYPTCNLIESTASLGLLHQIKAVKSGKARQGGDTILT